MAVGTRGGPGARKRPPRQPPLPSSVWQALVRARAKEAVAASRVCRELCARHRSPLALPAPTGALSPSTWVFVAPRGSAPLTAARGESRPASRPQLSPPNTICQQGHQNGVSRAASPTYTPDLGRPRARAQRCQIKPQRPSATPPGGRRGGGAKNESRSTGGEAGGGSPALGRARAFGHARRRPVPRCRVLLRAAAPGPPRSAPPPVESARAARRRIDPSFAPQARRRPHISPPPRRSFRTPSRRRVGPSTRRRVALSPLASPAPASPADMGPLHRGLPRQSHRPPPAARAPRLSLLLLPLLLLLLPCAASVPGCRCGCGLPRPWRAV